MPNLLRFYPMQWQLSDRRSQQIEKNDEQNVASYINTVFQSAEVQKLWVLGTHARGKRQKGRKIGVPH